MKRSLALALGIALLGVAPANYNAFGLSVLQRLTAGGAHENVVVSPVSLGIALAMAAEGARGTTRSAMLGVLGMSPGTLADSNRELIAALRADRDASLGLADALWLRNDLAPNPAYVRLVAGMYDAQVARLHFGDPSAADAINAWTREHTLGLIDRLVDATDPSDFLYLTNALAFHGDWALPFDPNATHPGPFTDGSGATHNVPMMSQDGSFATATLPDFRVLEMPYGAGGYAAYVLLPTRGTAQSLVRALTPESLEHALAAVQTTYLRVEMPRFTATYRADLARTLASMGMAVAFSPSADFSAMTSARVDIAGVTHDTYVRVDEKGTTAAAATGVEMRLTAVRLSQVPPFVVDRPFVFLIRERRTGAILFVGAIYAVASA